jgi:RHS repeat-associated protein
MVYDNNGNLTTNSYTPPPSGATNFTYDAENRMTDVQNGSNQTLDKYGYDADGHRVRRNINGTETWQVYDLDGELLAEYPAGGAATAPQKEYGYRGGELLVTASTSATLLSDDFNDNSLDTAKWHTAAPTSPTVVHEQNQHLEITLQPNTTGYNGIIANQTFDFHDATVQVEVVQPVSEAGWVENFVELSLDANNYYLIDTGAGSAVCDAYTNGVRDRTLIWTYDQTAMRFWRFRHSSSANAVYFETSADGTNWVTQKTVSTTFSLSSMRLSLYAGAWGTGNSNPGTAIYDNVLVKKTGSSADVEWLVADQLGTPRMVVDQTGSLSGVKRHDYLPYGEELYANTGGRTTTQGYLLNQAAETVRQQFTGYERDGETGLDYAHARYYANSQGRFTSPDPFTASAKLTDPQSLNRYAYVENQPTISTDPSGLMGLRGPLQGMSPALWNQPGSEVENLVEEDEARYEENLADTYAAVAEARAIEKQVQSGQLSVAEATEMVANNPMLEMVGQKSEIKEEQEAAIKLDRIELLDNGAAGLPRGPLGVPTPANTVATGTKMEGHPNTYSLYADPDKIDPDRVLAIRVTFLSTKKGLDLDPSLITVTTEEGRVRWNIVTEYLGQKATLKDYGQVIFRVQIANKEAPVNSIDVTVGGMRTPGFWDINSPTFKSKEYATFHIRLYNTAPPE